MKVKGSDNGVQFVATFRQMRQMHMLHQQQVAQRRGSTGVSGFSKNASVGYPASILVA